MKRPEGFDSRSQAPTNRGADTPASAPAKQKRLRTTAPASSPPNTVANAGNPPRTGTRRGRGKLREGTDTTPVSPRTARPPKQPGGGRKPADAETPRPKRADAQARKAARARRRYERSEVRRFTRRSRHRRMAWLVSAAALAVLCGLVAVAVYSPLLALKTLKVEGASRVSAADIRTALKDQIGTPLALLDFGQIKSELARFPLIRSYVTETVPPNTLIVHVVERAPIGVFETSSDYITVDAAGVEISHTRDRPEKLPIIDSGSLKNDSTAFKAAVAVLLALPPDVAARVDTVTASTNDDVTLVLDGVGQRVVWGSADRSAIKARVLADLISHQDANAVVEYDVSAPNNAVVRTG